MGALRLIIAIEHTYLVFLVNVTFIRERDLFVYSYIPSGEEAKIWDLGIRASKDARYDNAVWITRMIEVSSEAPCMHSVDCILAKDKVLSIRPSQRLACKRKRFPRSSIAFLMTQESKSNK